VDWCSFQAARWAVEHWHYSQTMPAGKLVRIGVWENDSFVGAVIYGRGALYNIGRPFNLDQTQICELVRVALTNHCTPTSRIVAISIKILKKNNPGLRMIVSYADSGKGHHGGIYQASGWVYVGESFDTYIQVKGEVKHRRSLGSTYGTNSIKWIHANVDPNASIVRKPAKYKYLMPLDAEMKGKIEHLRKPYPKRTPEVAA